MRSVPFRKVSSQKGILMMLTGPVCVLAAVLWLSDYNDYVDGSAVSKLLSLGFFLFGGGFWTVWTALSRETNPDAIQFDDKGMMMLRRSRMVALPWDRIGPAAVVWREKEVKGRMRKWQILEFPIREDNGEMTMIEFRADSLDWPEGMDDLVDQLQRARTSGHVTQTNSASAQRPDLANQNGGFGRKGLPA